MLSAPARWAPCPNPLIRACLDRAAPKRPRTVGQATTLPMDSGAAARRLRAILGPLRPRPPSTPVPPAPPLPPGPSPPRPAPPRPSHLRRPPRDGSGREPRPRRQGGSPGLEEKLHLGKPDGSLSLTRRVPCVPGCPRRPPPPKNDGNLREMYEPRPQIFDSVAINLKWPHKSDVNNDT